MRASDNRTPHPPLTLIVRPIRVTIVPRVELRALLDRLEQLNRSTTAETPWMGGKKRTVEISDGDPVIVPAWVIDMLDD